MKPFTGTHDALLWRFEADISTLDPPQQFTYPFHYTPHPLCQLAARQLMAYMGRQPEWADELANGKMLGVLVVDVPEAGRSAATPCFLAAFSGTLGGSNRQPHFVPPVADLLQPNGEYRQGERIITDLNRLITSRESSDERHSLLRELDTARQRKTEAVTDYRAFMATAKQRRDSLRPTADPDTLAALLAESQFQKAELKRLKRRHDAAIDHAANALADYDAATDTLRQERKQRSEQLQNRIFSLFVVSNARDERADLLTLFARFEGRRPPSGSGECCAPKLLQFAYDHGLRPLCMAEFWWGASPLFEVRHHGHFYPACRSKCLPILSFMLQGLDVEPNPSAQTSETDIALAYDDPWLSVVVKPAGMLSVPGKVSADSALTRWQQRVPEATGPMVVHRLDQETSGLLIFAKDKATHKALQALFTRHEAQKQYVAIVEGTVERDEGIIDLPLRPDPDDRPRQRVDPASGKPCRTAYRVLERLSGGRTRLLLSPLTGRTHQLRVHCSHPMGLNAPIVGDRLYGRADRRLMLHAQTLLFSHPVTGQCIEVSILPDF